MNEKPRLNTKSVRGRIVRAHRDRPVVEPIFQSATFEASSFDTLLRVPSADRFYTRYGNPTFTATETRIAELEGADGALVFASGMAAIGTALLAVLRAGDHLVVQSDIYGGALAFIGEWLPRYGIDSTRIEPDDPDGFERAMRKNTRAIYIESPSNPMLKVVDLKRIAELGRRHGAVTMIDNTFATPINQRPHEFGIDIVLHSGTKFLSGHSDLVCGAATGTKARVDELSRARRSFGGVMDPHASWLLMRGM
ncbi:MAG TPA: PLP-dependent aspartate aminotransferase family protein, partial [Polyangiaceae bacterium]|nr:PLP-dependent aspartate aminotransferase family protein [Polyangiaceae bacterium]